jgi:hypothetical protein
MDHVAPLFIGPANAIAVTGCPWRWVRDRAVELGVPILGTKKKGVINAAAFVAALECGSAAPNHDLEAPPSDAAEQLRRRLGLRLVGGAR